MTGRLLASLVILSVWAGLSGCPKQVPEHLRVDPEPKNVVPSASYDDRESLIDALVGRDPLVRAPTLPQAELALELDEPIGAWIEAVRQLEEGDGDASLIMTQMEERFPHTEMVAMARGYRLRRAENRVGNLTGSQAGGDLGVDLAKLLTPLRGQGAAVEGLTRSPLPFLGDDPGRGMRVVGERWVLAGWMSDPGLYTRPVTEALQAPQYDGLSESPTGRILLNRGQNVPASAQGLDTLRRATRMALTRAAADRDSEQVAWAEMKADARDELGVDTPTAALLEKAYDALSPATGSDAAAGGAWIAATGLRWLDACPDEPCGGFDRTQAFSDATRWGDEVEGLAHAWRVIALKDALDSMDSGHDTVIFPTAMAQLTDALLGTGAGPLDVKLLRRARGDASVWLGLARSVGADQATDWGTARTALGAHLRDVTEQAIAANPDNELTPLLQRVAKRAVK